MIYILDNNIDTYNIICYALTKRGYDVLKFENTSNFWDSISNKVPKLLLLGLITPQKEELQVLKRLRLRHETKALPIIVISSQSDEHDKIEAFEHGADDYIVKPFSQMELMARIKAQLRRWEEESERSEYYIDGLYVCPSKYIVKNNGKSVRLNLKEFKILCLLLEKNGSVISKDSILQEIWANEYQGKDRTVNSYIRTLRAKLGEYGKIIETVTKIGYRINLPS